MLAASGAARGCPRRSLVVGVNDDAVKWHPGISSIANDLGLGYLPGDPGLATGTDTTERSDVASINAAVANAGSQKIVLSVFGSPDTGTASASSRAAYCGFVSSLLDRVPQIAAVNIWNGANLSHFWKRINRNGSSAAPAAFEAPDGPLLDTIDARTPRSG